MACYGSAASNWDRGILDELCCSGYPPPGGSVQCRTRLPPLPPECCRQPDPSPYDSPAGNFHLPPLNQCNDNNNVCGNHPRDDCCRIPPPQCSTGAPCIAAICVERTRPIRPTKVYEPPNQPFNGSSTYRVDYRGCYGMPAKMLRPGRSFDPAGAKMEGNTTYRTCYIPYCSAEVEYARGKSVKPTQDFVQTCQPFNACSTYQSEYVPKCGTKAMSVKPANRVGFPDAPFADRTTYKNDYLPFYFSDCCPDPCRPRNSCCMPKCC